MQVSENISKEDGNEEKKKYRNDYYKLYHNKNISISIRLMTVIQTMIINRTTLRNINIIIMTIIKNKP